MNEVANMKKLENMINIEDIKVIISYSIDEIPKELWDNFISENHPAKSTAFIHIVERHGYKTEKFYYMILYYKSKIIGCIMLTLNNIDTALFLPNQLSTVLKAIRRIIPNFMILKTLQTGSLETLGRHWWYDEDFIHWGDFVKLVLRNLKLISEKYSLEVFRDFFSDYPSPYTEEIKRCLTDNGFKEINSLPLAVVDIPDGCKIEDYLYLLHRKKRWLIRKILKERQEKGLKIDISPMIPELVDEVYPLYVNVVERAKEFKTPPHSKKLFKAFCEAKNLTTSVITIRQSDYKLVACIVNFESDNILAPFFIGMDYDVNRKYDLYYNILWNSICLGINNGKKTVDLGLTTYDIKRWLGADLRAIKIFVRFRSYLANKILSHLLKPLLEVHD